MDISRLLSEPRRQWIPGPSAEEPAIRHLLGIAPVGLPLEFMLLAELNASDDGGLHHPGYFVFGSNGGLESIAFDVRSAPPWVVVMSDPIAGLESIEPIANDMAAFIAAIGLASPEEDD